MESRSDDAFAPLPRKGTETLTCLFCYSKFKKIGLSLHYPARGRKPEHILRATVCTPSCTFRSITPQGDGNSRADLLLRSTSIYAFAPLPRKGTETALYEL